MVAQPPVDLTRRIKDIVHHVGPLPGEARSPILHYLQTVTAIRTALRYTERAFSRSEGDRPVADSHLDRIYGMALVSFIQSFERFLKELAAECVDHLADFVADDRFNVFKIQGSSLASHFATGTLGKSLCESATWLDCEEINKRFRELLADPFQSGGPSFHLFPRPNQLPAEERARHEPMSVVWQLRHTAVHNVGVITQSDGVKLRLLMREPVAAPSLLAPTRKDLRYLKRFLDETAAVCNRRVGERLADLLTTLHGPTPGLLPPQEVADRVAASFRIPVTVAGVAGTVPPD